MFEIFYDKQPLKFLKKLDKDSARRIMDKADMLSSGPITHDTKAIIGEHGAFRIRVGGFRVLYRANFNDKMAVVFKIDKRSRVYSRD